MNTSTSGRVLSCMVPVLSWFATANSLMAENRDAGIKPVVRVGLGAGIGGTEVAGETNSQIEILFTGQLGLSILNRVALLIDLQYQPFKVENPVRAEAFQLTYLLGSLEVTIYKDLFFRLGFGSAHFSWSGADVWVSSEKGLAGGFAFGWGLKKISKLKPALEVFLRGASVPELSATTIGLQATIAF